MTIPTFYFEGEGSGVRRGILRFAVIQSEQKGDGSILGNWGRVSISLLKMQREGKKNRRKENHRLLAYQAEEALKKAVGEAIAEHKR